MKLPASIAALRPGATEDEVRLAYGDRWRRPGPHDEGWLWGFRAEVPANLRFTRNGTVGQITFSPWSPRYPVEGLAAGMTLAQAQALMPQLAALPPEPDAAKYGFSHHRAALPSGWEIMVSVKDGTLQGTVSLEDPQAAYPDDAWVQREVDAAHARFLPLQPDSTPFRDRNLKLAVLDTLLADRRIQLGEPAEFAQFVLRRRCDLEREGYERIEAAHDALARLPLTDDELAAVTWLDFGGGSEVVRHAHYFWNGETGDFDVHDLSGLDRLPALETLSLDERCRVTDLRQIAGLGLQELALGLGPYEHEAVLLSALPRLRRLSLFSGALSQPTCDALRARGVQLRFYE